MCEKGAEPTDGGGSAATCPDEGAVQTSSCKKCDPGRFKAGSGSEKCAPCGVGKYCVEGATAEAVCLAGRYCPQPQIQFNCTKKGTHCPAGSTSAGDCREGYYCPTVTKEVQCAKGKWCAAGSFKEAPCPAGRLCAQTGTQAEDGGELPKKCRQGTHCPEGSFEETPCKAGTFSADPQVACADCPAGKFQASDGKASCDDCKAGEYCAAGATAAAPCIAGTFSADPKEKCVPCEAGSFSKSTGSATCTACTKGTTYQDAAGPCAERRVMTLCCALCAALRRTAQPLSALARCCSHQWLWTGQDKCKGCTACGVGYEPFGKGCTFVADQQCSKCPIGKAGEGSSKCAKCAKGRFQDESGLCGGLALCVPHFVSAYAAACCRNMADHPLFGTGTLVGAPHRQGLLQSLHVVREGSGTDGRGRIGRHVPRRGGSPVVVVQEVRPRTLQGREGPREVQWL